MGQTAWLKTMLTWQRRTSGLASRHEPCVSCRSLSANGGREFVEKTLQRVHWGRATLPSASEDPSPVDLECNMEAQLRNDVLGTRHGTHSRTPHLLRAVSTEDCANSSTTRVPLE